MRYVLDTNIISQVMKNDKGLLKKLGEKILLGDELCINAISYYEIKRGLMAAGMHHQKNSFENFIRKCDIVLLDSIDIFDKAAEIYSDLRRQGKSNNDADILIAATTMCKNGDSILVTRDEDFNNISGISLEKW